VCVFQQMMLKKDINEIRMTATVFLLNTNQIPENP